jgi:hypothetical protein
MKMEEKANLYGFKVRGHSEVRDELLLSASMVVVSVAIN